MAGAKDRSRFDLIRLLASVSRPLLAGAVLTTLLEGVVPPAFNLTAGLFVGAVPAAVGHGLRSPAGSRATHLLIVAAALYVFLHALGPLAETVGDILMRRVDASLAERMITTVSGPAGLGHLEDPAVLDGIAQAQGAVTGATPGTAAYFLVGVWGSRLQATVSLLIVAHFRWWLAVVLFGAHLVAFRWRRWHWNQVVRVIFDNTGVLRRSHYLREVATSHAAAKETRVFSLGGWLVDRYRSTFLDSMGEVWRQRRRGALVAVAVSAGMLVVEGGVLVLIARAGVTGSIGLGAVIVYAQATVAASVLSVFHEGHVYLEEGAAALKVLRDLETAVPHGSHLTGSASADGLPAGTLRFEGVRFRYPGREEEVFAGLDLDIPVGHSLAIVGDNGAGKTTLVKLLARLYEPTGGRITVDGIDLREVDPAGWQRRVAAIFQDFVHYHLSAYDNVAFGALHLAADEHAVAEAVAQAGAATVLGALPAGLATPLSRQFEGGTDLSGGEWQRVALAHALMAVAGGAGILILDEPTAALDVRGEAEIYDRFLELTRGVTTIVISHRFSTVRRADRIVVLEHGRVVESGRHDDLVTHGGRYAHMYRLQAARFQEDPVP